MRPNDSDLRFDLVPYFHGRILDVSEGSSRAFPHFICHIELGITEAHQCRFIADKSLDGVVSSYLLDKLSTSEVIAALKEWVRIVKDGGHIVLHVPLTDEKSVWAVRVDTIINAMPGNWDMVCQDHRADGSLLAVFRIGGEGKIFSWKLPKPEKTCAVVRLGAFGDMIQASSIFPWLKEQGYHLTVYTSDHGAPVIKHDPNIDRIIIQGRDEVPAAALWSFWEHEKKKYDKWINLSESVEGTLLAAHGSAAFGWPNEVRAKHMDRNYLEFTHEIAGVPPPYAPRFYATQEEKLWAKEKARSYGRRNILWSLSGSAPHKAWPHLDAVVAAIMLAYPDTHVVMVADELSQVLETGWGKERRVHKRSGEWTIRQSMAFAEVADLIIGTETGLLNAAAMMDTPKIVTLSHSSHEMLTKHWRNVTALSQPKGTGCPKQPCRQLHMDWTDCPRHPSGASSLCQYEISAEMMMNAVVRVLGEPQRMVA